MKSGLIIGKYKFAPNIYLSIAFILSLSLFIILGFWQIQRAHAKEQILLAQEKVKDELPINWSEQISLLKAFAKIEISGKFLPQIFLLDNQHYKHQFGYNVLAPLLTSANKIILVDFGWVAGDREHNLPKIIIPENIKKLRGTIYYPGKKAFVLGNVLEKKSDTTTIIECLDFKLLKELLHKSFYPFIIRLDKSEPFGFVREWAVVSMPPSRHYGYAFQWFAFALVIVIIYISLNLKKKDET